MKLLQQLNQDANTLLRSCRALLNSVRRDGLLASVRAVLPRLFQFRRLVIQEKDLTERSPEPVSLPGVSIRHATVEDISLFRESLSHCHTEYELAVQTQNIAAGQTYYIALEDGRIVHYCRIRKPGDGICELPLADGEAESGPTYTVPEARGRGIHRNVKLQIWTELADAGYRKVLALVRPNNRASLWANQKAGYKRVGMITIVRLFGMTIFRRVQRC